MKRIETITKVPTQESLSLKAAERIARLIADKPDCCIGLPTGRTPRIVYKILADTGKQHVDGARLNWSAVKCFSLDEYVDVSREGSFRYYLEEHLYNHVNVSATNIHTPADTPDYDGLIARCGGLDLVILGLGLNGHIAFNEPGTPLLSWTHATWLDESTRKANLEFFGSSMETVPTRAVTIGIQTILASKQIMLLAAGESKREILKKAMHGPVTNEVPASLLRTHSRFEVLADFDW